ncbi:DUF4367 domain-containing protein [Brevibacillus humidisoli]|uniref:DUF4367 domain-containing protein n=1 Tax=Brevibacillus humidisoli TaxID=2895522 RepID=UPI001E367A6E|nr:DUF4367 domain-containing protein [Brevibacillus humidisoli]UFJ40885.1 DUF4367 domain-containing protein [Brevibacillus humidisoli]
MKKGIAMVGLLATMTLASSGLLYADTNKVQHKQMADNHIVSQPATVSMNEAEKLMSNIKISTPEEIPEGYQLDGIIYNEPPKEFANGVKPDITSQKEVVMRYKHQTKSGNWIEHTIKSGKISIGDEGKKAIKLNGVKGEILEYPEEGIIALNWHKDGVSHFVLSKGDLAKEELIKFAESIK